MGTRDEDVEYAVEWVGGYPCFIAGQSCALPPATTAASMPVTGNAPEREDGGRHTA
jgi:hypothetical protein